MLLLKKRKEESENRKKAEQSASAKQSPVVLPKAAVAPPPPPASPSTPFALNPKPVGTTEPSTPLAFQQATKAVARKKKKQPSREEEPEPAEKQKGKRRAPPSGDDYEDEEAEDESLMAEMAAMHDQFIAELSGKAKADFFAVRSAHQGLTKMPKDLRRGAQEEAVGREKKKAKRAREAGEGVPNRVKLQKSKPNLRSHEKASVQRNKSEKRPERHSEGSNNPAAVSTSKDTTSKKKKKGAGGLFSANDSLWED